MEKNKSQERQLENMNYPPGEDIFSQEERVSIDGDGVPETAETPVTKNLDDGLDVPGSELDDEQEQIGEEDEENNYWSLGGENHENLEEPENQSAKKNRFKMH
ncbi:hypothetical protein [Chryseobacterium sp. R2A-55]|uniref:hypothetical protein n=1 Tax=Chryseobacterium sp. R2A-55 TaxID=2744445 RepID=UPI003977F759